MEAKMERGVVVVQIGSKSCLHNTVLQAPERQTGALDGANLGTSFKAHSNTLGKPRASLVA